jgi:uncharacterized peroxidase-related enzyme
MAKSKTAAGAGKRAKSRRKLHALDLKEARRDRLEPEMAAFFKVCEERLGFVPNILRAYSFHPVKLRTFADFYDELMLADSGLSKLEREMIAVVVSSLNHCFYCLTAHGWSIRQLSGDPILGELMVMNYRAADLKPRQKAMLDFAAKMTEASHEIEEADRETLRKAGFSDAEIWDIAAVAGFFNMSNRMASALHIRPNDEYHGLAR